MNELLDQANQMMVVGHYTLIAFVYFLSVYFQCKKLKSIINEYT
jgi:hypothetical protein